METIHTKTHTLLVDEKIEIDDQELHYSERYKDIHSHKHRNNEDTCHKIIAAYPPLEGCLDFETLPPNTEEDVIQLAKNNVLNRFKSDTDLEQLNCYKHIETFIAGYKQAKSETMFSLDDMNRAFEAGMKFIGEDKGSFNEFLQSLTKPKEYEFVPEIDSTLVGLDLADKGQPKVINNKIYGSWKPRSIN